MSEIVISNCDIKRWPRRTPKLPSAFTEHGVAMLSSVLRSKRAVQVNVAIVRTFVSYARLAAHFEGNLAPDEGKAGAEFDKKLAHVLQQSPSQAAAPAPPE